VTDASSAPNDPTGPPPDAVAALAAELERLAPSISPPPAVRSPAALARYVGDAVAVVYHGGTRAERLALLARLTALSDPPAAGLPPRLARVLRRWERMRRAGAAGPRPTAQQLHERVELLLAAGAEGVDGGAEVVAVAVAELVAQELLAGSVPVEHGIRVVRELEPLAEASQALLRGTGLELPPHVFERPGATLAHLDHVLWLLESLAGSKLDADDLRAARDLWVECAAALVFVDAAGAGGAGSRRRWTDVTATAVDLLTLGELVERPAGYDWRAALALARSAALRFAGAWLDAARHGEPLDAEAGAGHLREAAARALAGAWAAERIAAAQRSS